MSGAGISRSRLAGLLNPQGASWAVLGLVGCSVTAVSLRRVARADCPWGWVVDVVAVSEAVAGLLATGAAKELGQEAGGGLVAGRGNPRSGFADLGQ